MESIFVRNTAGSLESWKSTLSRQGAYSHPLYLVQPPKMDAIVITGEESRFSSCSTSPNSSCESLNLYATPSVRNSSISSPCMTPAALSVALSSSSSNRTSQSSYLSTRYADDHYPLISRISSSSMEANTTILDMAHAYNTYIRAINSCYNHALVLDDDEVDDFLFFNQTLFNILSQHLKMDHQYLRPLLHRPGEYPGFAMRKKVGLFEDSNLLGEELQSRISAFAPLLVQHLHDEVAQLTNLLSENSLMPEHLGKIWARFEESLSGVLDLYTDTALLVGCHDRNFTICGHKADHKFPKLPIGTTTMVKKWHSRKHDGAWRFCSSDFSGRRRVIST